MTAVLSLLLVLALSMLVIRVGSVALLMTGVSEDVASFQALSAFSGAGFTTDEAESMVTDPARRRITAILIRLGSVGLATSIATLLLSFVGAGPATPERLLVLLLGVGALVGLARSTAFHRMLTPLIERTLDRYTTLQLRDYASLLHLQQDYRIVEIDVENETWLAHQRLEDLDLTREGVLVLGVVRPDDGYIGAPQPTLELRPQDRIIAYGRNHRLQELSLRKTGNQKAHRDAVAEHEDDVEKQQAQLGETPSA